MVGNRVLQGYFWNAVGDKLGDEFGDFGDKMKILNNTRILSISLLGAEIYNMYYMLPCDVTPFWEDNKYRSCRTSGNVLIDWDHLWSANAFVVSVLEFYPQCELVIC
ncbi:hypothetical protein AVEN_88614-1 [Araneus ventricosus]|uniref:Uncharacterized protein n=1 Tax=Araneus ventricosus TaxID=182803 RepID=A0A4Y2FRC1_ARAVE|nr:hypothetical protein AVEN_88614-1 [Araneus ventricosus]